jgi:hypothetical protein
MSGAFRAGLGKGFRTCGQPGGLHCRRALMLASRRWDSYYLHMLIVVSVPVLTQALHDAKYLQDADFFLRNPHSVVHIRSVYRGKM